MYSFVGFPRTISWLLAAALAIQPMGGFSCGCQPSRVDAAPQPGKRHCCGCCRMGQRCCCGCCRGLAHRSPTAGEEGRSCCSHNLSRDRAPAEKGICHCSSRSPAPPVVPAERSHADDLVAAASHVYAVVVDAAADRGASWVASLPTESLFRLRTLHRPVPLEILIPSL